MNEHGTAYLAEVDREFSNLKLFLRRLNMELGDLTADQVVDRTPHSRARLLEATNAAQLITGGLNRLMAMRDLVWMADLDGKEE